MLEVIVAPAVTPVDEWEAAVEGWLASRGCEKTRRAYAAAWGDFRGYLEGPAWLAAPGDVQGWVDGMVERGLSGATVNQRLAAISSLYRYACERHWVVGPDGTQRPLHDRNPARGVRRQTVLAFGSASYLNAEQVRALLGAIDRRSAGGLQAYALITAYLFTGQRNRVIRSLRKGDFRRVGGRWQYRWENKGRSRWDEMPAPAMKAVLAYLRAAGRDWDGLRDDDYLFMALSRRAERLPTVEAMPDRPLSEQYVNRMLRRWARAAGLEAEQVHVHTLRHTSAEALRAAGASIHEASRFLAHANTAVTERYFDHLDGVENVWWATMATAWQLPLE